MAHKRPLFTVECDALTAIDEDGNEYAPRAGEWVRFYRRMPAKLVRVLTQAAGFESASDEEAAGVMGEVLDDLVPRLAQAIHSWNWSDTWSENGAALPDPTGPFSTQLAVMRAADGRGGLPWELVEAGLCERFRILPEQLDQADVGRLLRLVDTLELFRALKKAQTGGKLTESEHQMIGKVLKHDLERQRA
jgi:hypothetical protein